MGQQRVIPHVLLNLQSSYTLSSGNELKNHKEVIPDENVEIDTMTKPDGSIQVIVTDFNRVFEHYYFCFTSCFSFFYRV